MSKPLIPPHPNAEAHRKLMERLRQMTSAEIVETARKAGIYDEHGNLTPEYGGEPMYNHCKPGEDCECSEKVERTIQTLFYAAHGEVWEEVGGGYENDHMTLFFRNPGDQTLAAWLDEHQQLVVEARDIESDSFSV